jgi:putative membrane protein
VQGHHCGLAQTLIGAQQIPHFRAGASAVAGLSSIAATAMPSVGRAVAPADPLLSCRPMKLIIRWLLLAAALLLVTHLYPGVSVTSFGAALIAAFVLGLLNTVVRPLLVLLTLPVTLLTLGLFLFVINALMFWAAAEVLPGDGLKVSGFTAALIGSLIYSLCGMVIDVAVERLFNRS